MKETLTVAIMLLQVAVCLASNNQKTISKGIRWTEGLTWNQLKAKAKSDGKYIFVDCFTTWCGPCKRMDKEVYTDDSVGSFMNSKFISVKLQMDRTNNDGESIKLLYDDAEMIMKEYSVNYYPSFLFFSPEGQIVHRAGSYAPPAQFIAIASKAINAKEQFYTLLKKYEQGVKDYLLMPYLIQTAKKNGQLDVEQRLRSDFLSYLFASKREELYTSDRIEFLASSIQGTKSVFFKMFYPDGNRINAVMKQSGYARRVVDSTIAREYINPILSHMSAGQEPNWEAIHDKITIKFGYEYAERNIICRKAKWYGDKGDAIAFKKNFFRLMDINGLDTSDHARRGDRWINFVAYNYIFGGNTFFTAGSTDTTEINTAIRWMEGVVKRASKYTTEWQCTVLDTYSMLLYKGARKQEAIEIETLALKIAVQSKLEDDINDFKSKLDKMQRNEPTW